MPLFAGVESPRKAACGPGVHAGLRRCGAGAIRIVHYNRCSHYYPPVWWYCDEDTTGSDQTLFCWRTPGKTRLLVRLSTFTALDFSGYT